MSSTPVHFPAVSLGFLGQTSAESTLGSRLLSNFIRKSNGGCPQEFEMFPQRVPVTDFFDELSESETPEFNIEFEKMRGKCLLRFRELETNFIDASAAYCNFLDLCARLGLLSEISVNDCSAVAESRIDWLARYKFLSYRIAYCNSAGIKIDVSGLNEAIQGCEDPLMAGLLLLRLIVTYRRYFNTDCPKSYQANVTGLLKYLNTCRPETPFEAAWISMIWRAIPMTGWFSSFESETMMIKALEAVDAINVREPAGLLMRDELRITTLYSVSKFYFHETRFVAAEKALREAWKLDSNDSVTAAELAHFYYRTDDFSTALEFFDRSTELGPPSLGMNTYFKAKCLNHLGKTEQALKDFELSARLDPYGVSSMLELIDIHLSRSDRSKACKYAQKLLLDPILLNQLSADEVRMVRNV